MCTHCAGYGLSRLELLGDVKLMRANSAHGPIPQGAHNVTTISLFTTNRVGGLRVFSSYVDSFMYAFVFLYPLTCVFLACSSHTVEQHYLSLYIARLVFLFFLVIALGHLIK
jgi:hypothetical protein